MCGRDGVRNKSNRLPNEPSTGLPIGLGGGRIGRCGCFFLCGMENKAYLCKVELDETPADKTTECRTKQNTTELKTYR